MNRTEDIKAPAKRRAPAKKPSAPQAKASAPKKTALLSPGTGRNPRAKSARSARQATLLKQIKIHSRRRSGVVTAASLLGVKITPQREVIHWAQWISIIRHGISPSAVDSLTGFLHISQADLSSTLNIPLRTLVRRKGAELLPSDETAKLVRMARVIERAEDVFEDTDAARVWLKTRNASLSGETPMSMLDTEVGAGAIMDTLGRIEHGVFA